MIEEEIMLRARRACADEWHLSIGYIKSDLLSVKVAQRALRDLDKPIIDPVTEKLRKLVTDAGFPPDTGGFDLALAAYRLGKEDAGS